MRVAAATLMLLFAAAVQAADVGGRVKVDAIGYDAGGATPDAALGHETSGEIAAQLRLELSQDYSPWQFDAAWQLDARHGSAVERDHGLAANYPALSFTGNDESYWDLTDRLTDSGADQVIQRLDRLSVSYTSTAFVARLGRQALTWGGGLVFHPMDLVNPFQPVATDTAYKRGTDMAYGQWLMDDGSDIQLVMVPHQRHDSTAPGAGKSTWAAFANVVGDTLQWTILVARDHGDEVAGIGTSGPLGGATWNLEVIPTYLDRGGTRVSALANITQAGTFLNRNLTAFIELYHNGFGQAGGDYTVAQLNDDLLARLERGQQFVTGRDYAALGATWEWTPLLQLMPTLIVDAHDGSTLLDVQLSRSLTNNVSLKAGLRLPVGARGTEFGGLELAPGAGVYVARDAQAFVRVEDYF